MHVPTFYLPMLAAALFASRLQAQGTPQPEYLDTALPAQQRARDLVQRMTVEEKVTQLVNQSRAIPRLNVPAYDWWSEALHGVASERHHRISGADRACRDFRY